MRAMMGLRVMYMHGPEGKSTIAHAYTLYTTKAERHEGQKRKTARMVELMSSVVLQP